MFCSRCGTQLPDDAKFCPTCGAAVGAEETPKAEAPKTEEAPKATPSASGTTSKKFPAPFGSMKTFGPKGAFRLPDIPGFVMLGIATIVFFLSDMGLWRATVENPYTGQKIKYVYSILMADIFKASPLLGFAKIFMILSILIAVAYFAYFFIDFAKLTNGKLPEKLLIFLPIAYFGLVALSLLLTFVGALTVNQTGVRCGPTFGWFLTFLFCGAGVVFTLLPGLLDNILGSIFKKK